MIMAIEYTVQKGGIYGKLNSVYDDGDRLVEASTWLTGPLCIHFSSLDDIDKAIIALQELRKKVIDHMNKTHHQFIPNVYQNSNEPTIDIILHDPDGFEVTTTRLDKRKEDVITLRHGGGCEDLDRRNINIYVPAGQAKRIGHRIIASVAHNGNENLKEIEDE